MSNTETNSIEREFTDLTESLITHTHSVRRFSS